MTACSAPSSPLSPLPADMDNTLTAVPDLDGPLPPPVLPAQADALEEARAKVHQLKLDLAEVVEVLGPMQATRDEGVADVKRKKIMTSLKKAEKELNQLLFPPDVVMEDSSKAPPAKLPQRRSRRHTIKPEPPLFETDCTPGNNSGSDVEMELAGIQGELTDEAMVISGDEEQSLETKAVDKNGPSVIVKSEPLDIINVPTQAPGEVEYVYDDDNLLNQELQSLDLVKPVPLPKEDTDMNLDDGFLAKQTVINVQGKKKEAADEESKAIKATQVDFEAASEAERKQKLVVDFVMESCGANPDAAAHVLAIAEETLAELAADANKAKNALELLRGGTEEQTADCSAPAGTEQVNALVAWEKGGQVGDMPAVDDHIRALVCNNADFLPVASVTSRLLSVHMLTNRYGFSRCMHHLFKWAGREVRVDFDPVLPHKVNGSPYPPDSATPGATTRLNPERGTLNCGCTEEDSLYHFILYNFIELTGIALNDLFVGEKFGTASHNTTLFRVALTHFNLGLPENAVVRGIPHQPDVEAKLRDALDGRVVEHFWGHLA
ncbi:hypothetical protein C8R43DRAFT_949440 [Mycena crocata]|nr:hypothetical protein C8R43DRAFT_949440 [Mycena crocata]